MRDKIKQLLEMKSLVNQAENILTDNHSDLNEFGRLLDYTWKLKRGISAGISTDSIDAFYQRAIAAVAIKAMHEFNRYGTVEVQDGQIISFREKQYCKDGWINGGIYCMKCSILASFPMVKFSLEKDFMEKKLAEMKLK
ncbi:hypothetical protein [Mitsuokella jalaludinii]|uniref:hypothetical protein n=1 Tax=Mitsuokella jalaludinii TaxID=187979 RepID=UPI0020D04850|nr:hypothetical protein [Mitsuokella jalaludinii]MCQ1534021.1 hypothetical protein [Mitsuokella jalaludinii]